MDTQHSCDPASPAFRLRQTFGALRGSARTGQTPLVVVLPWGTPDRDSRAVFHLGRGERVSPVAVAVALEVTRSGGSAVFACASLAEATAAFSDLAHAAGYPVAEGVAQ